MDKNKIKETLEKQLQLLSERSAETKNRDYMELAKLSESMCLLAETRKSVRSSEAGLTGSCGHWELNSEPLEEQ